MAAKGECCGEITFSRGLGRPSLRSGFRFRESRIARYASTRCQREDRRPPKHCHGLALLVNHVINGRSNRYVRPQIACAPVSSPPPAARSAFLHIQLVCAVRLQGNHQSFRRAIGCGYNVNMIGSHMCGRQQPALQRADFYYCRENNLSTIFRQQVRLLAHVLRSPDVPTPCRIRAGGH